MLRVALYNWGSDRFNVEPKERIADLQGRFAGAGVGDAIASVGSYQKAVTIRSALVEYSRQDPEDLRSEASLLGGYNRRLLAAGKTQEALSSARTRVALAQQLRAKRPQDVRAQVEVADADLTLAWVLGAAGSTPSTREFPEAIALDRAAIDMPRVAYWRSAVPRCRTLYCAAVRFESTDGVRIGHNKIVRSALGAESSEILEGVKIGQNPRPAVRSRKGHSRARSAAVYFRPHSRLSSGMAPRFANQSTCLGCG